MNPILSLLAFSGFLSLVSGDACSDSLAQNNKYRSQHGSPAMKCNAQISKDAQAYANKLAQNCDMKHSGDKRYGENLYKSGSSGNQAPAPSTVAKAAVDSWYSEEQCYDYNDPQFRSCRASCKQGNGCKMQVGHFTQLVWKKTTEVGVGVASCRKDGWLWTIVVANYKPPGNMGGQFAENVQRKR